MKYEYETYDDKGCGWPTCKCENPCSHIKPQNRNGWLYFNHSNSEWEFTETKPADNDDVSSIEKCTFAHFCGRFPNHEI